MRLLIFVLLVALSLADQKTDRKIAAKRKPWHHHVRPDKKNWTTTRTEVDTSTTTVTVTSSTAVVCAKLVNVTGACRRRKNLWMDEPQVLTFDDELDDAVDVAFSPTRPIEIEQTVKPTRSTSPLKLIGSFTDQEEELKPRRIPLLNQLMKRLLNLNDDDDEDDRGRKIRTIFIVTSTSVQTLTSTTTVTTATKSFFVQCCTPSPFPFSVCLP